VVSRSFRLSFRKDRVPLSKASPNYINAYSFIPARPFAAGTFLTGHSTTVGAILPSFHAANESLILAFPSPASSGTRTGPRKSVPQQRWSKTTLTLIGLPPGFLLGNSICATGWASAGTALFWTITVVLGPNVPTQTHKRTSSSVLFRAPEAGRPAPRGEG